MKDNERLPEYYVLQSTAKTYKKHNGSYVELIEKGNHASAVKLPSGEVITVFNRELRRK